VAELVDGNTPVTLEAQLQLVLASRVLVSQVFTLNVEPTLFAIGDGSDLALLPTPRTRLGSDGTLQVSPNGSAWFALTIDTDGIVTTQPVP
jgi:hypothetical protein